jgi:hypothetical protein
VFGFEPTWQARRMRLEALRTGQRVMSCRPG